MLVKTLKSNEAFKVFTSKCLNPVIQCANCLMIDAYYEGKVRFIWSEKILVKIRFVEKI